MSQQWYVLILLKHRSPIQIFCKDYLPYSFLWKLFTEWNETFIKNGKCYVLSARRTNFDMCNGEQSKQSEVSLTTDNLYIANRNQNLYRSNFSATIPMYYQWFGILYKGCFTIMRLVLRQMHATSWCVGAGVCVCANRLCKMPEVVSHLVL